MAGSCGGVGIVVAADGISAGSAGVCCVGSRGGGSDVGIGVGVDLHTSTYRYRCMELVEVGARLYCSYDVKKTDVCLATCNK
eukprot:gene2891-5713_t